MKTVRLTAAQALIRFLRTQYIERDELVQPFFAGCFGIFGHGNLAGIGQALQQNLDFTYYQARNEQAMVHAAVAYARAKNRLQTFACTSSIGPGATNMVTAAALATINRLPVLLLPGDVFVRRNVAPVLQQLESEHSQDVSVNDCFKPVSRYWDRISRPEQLLTSLPEAMRVLTSPAETGAVTIALPQDVQAEAFDYPADFFEMRTWTIERRRADQVLLKRAAEWIKTSKAPVIIAGGGVIYSDATDSLSRFANTTGIAVAETQAGKGALHYQHPLSLGAVGVTGTPQGNRFAAQADLVIGIGTRYSDFTTASHTAFKNPNVRFININVSDFDSHKMNALPVKADARSALDELLTLLTGSVTEKSYLMRVERLHSEWESEMERHFSPPGKSKDSAPSQGEVIGVLNKLSGNKDVIVSAAGSLPGDLHKLWCPRDPKSYHVEYGYSCMGYEIAAGMGVKMASPDREVFVLVGDGSYLMMAQELITAVQERIKIVVLLLDNNGYASIGSLSRALGSDGFGTTYRYRSKDGQLNGDYLPVDLAANARSMGVNVIKANTRWQLHEAVKQCKSDSRAAVIVVPVETSAELQVPAYDSWWDVPVAEVSEMPSVNAARQVYEERLKEEKLFFKSKPALEGAKS